MAPSASGFNLLGWVAPFAALAGGALGVAALLRNWRRAPRPVLARSPSARPTDASDDELARLDAAVRDDR
jgi:hypothetical protein